MKERRVRKSTVKPVNNSLVGCGQGAACSLDDDRCSTSLGTGGTQQPRVSHGTGGTQHPHVSLGTDMSQRRTTDNLRVCRQYRRRRERQIVTTECDNAVSRLGIASHLL